ncbi:CPBP family intramembrane metalloprotease [Rhodohalobacter sp. SW132]|uniref:type II CAAX endopeptidase family protein n=1 Tax=Rhodohalobacter sp. SW132 TaxID=2293433 RepID=UPI000E25385C|nr:type II CAAX endopeptidase family protein [Rhodohalobacter sp. SW132]REL37734.1 CPBP family intramembrane metalloprotease [Rhodohalobacter sp. SW132]
MNKPDKPLIYFFLIAFALAWTVMALPIAQNFGLLPDQLPFEILLILGSWMPNIAAFIVIGFIIKRKGGIKALLKGWMKWKMHPGWYLLALSPVLFGFVTIFIFQWIYGYSPSTELFADPVAFIGLLVLITITGAMGEELGWRGFALPGLQLRMNALSASILLGIIWALWHLPLWFAGLGFETIPFWAYMLIGVSFSILVTAACNSSGGSLLIATLFHLFLNVSVNMIENEAFSILATVFVIAAIIITAVFGPRKLSRVTKLPIDKEERAWIQSV